MWEVAQLRWNDPTGRPVPFLKASFEVTLHRPTSLGPSVQLNASPERIDPSHIRVKSEMSIDDKGRATMTASWARVRSLTRRSTRLQRIEVGRMKSAAGVRTVGIPPVIMDDLRTHLARWSEPGPNGQSSLAGKFSSFCSDELSCPYEARGSPSTVISVRSG